MGNQSNYIGRQGKISKVLAKAKTKAEIRFTAKEDMNGKTEQLHQKTRKIQQSLAKAELKTEIRFTAKED